MKLRRRILKSLVILVLAYGIFQGLHVWRNSYVCVHQTKRVYPYPGSPYHAELYDEICSDFGAWGFTSLRLVKPGLFGTKLGSKEELFVYDPADNLGGPDMRWIKPDVLEVRLPFVKPHNIDPPIEEMDGIKIIYVFGKGTIDNPPRINLKVH